MPLSIEEVSQDYKFLKRKALTVTSERTPKKALNTQRFPKSKNDKCGLLIFLWAPPCPFRTTTNSPQLSLFRLLLLDNSVPPKELLSRY